MRFTRIALLFAVISSGWIWLQPAHAQDITIPDGVVAREIPPAAQSGIADRPGESVLIEIFDYTCSDCRVFQPMFDNWAMQQPDDIDIMQLPYLLGSSMDSDLQELAGRAYITLMIMGGNGYPTQSQLAHRQFFDEILPFYENMIRSDPPGTYKDMLNFMAAQVAREGIDKDEFEKIFFSQEVNEAVKSIREAEQSFDVPAIPAIIVNGKYYIVPASRPTAYDDCDDPYFYDNCDIHADNSPTTEEVYNGMLKLAGQLAHHGS